jgi:hypothetical protein
VLGGDRHCDGWIWGGDRRGKLCEDGARVER